jgi:fatty-acyl-CoA synthase
VILRAHAAVPLHRPLLMGLLPPLAAGGAAALRRQVFRVGLPARRPQTTAPRCACYVGKAARLHPRHRRSGPTMHGQFPAAWPPSAAKASDDRHRQLSPDASAARATDSYGSSEGCITVLRDAGNATAAPSASGRQPEQIRGAESRTPARNAPAHVFDARRQCCMNGNAAIGELVHLDGREALFEGYWDNPHARRATRLRNGARTGAATSPIATPPASSTFAGRDSEWLRVDGENLVRDPDRAGAGAPPAGSAVAAVYGVPGPPRRRPRDGGAATAPPATRFDPVEQFERVPRSASTDFGGKWKPSLPAALQPSICRTTADQQGAEARAPAGEAWECADTGLVAALVARTAPTGASSERGTPQALAPPASAARGRGHLHRIGGG